MIMFWIIAVAMMLLAVAVLLPPLLGGSHYQGVNREALNVAIYKERLAELDNDQADAAQREQVRHEIERELIEDTRDAGEKGQPRHKAGRSVAVIVALAIPLVSVVLYSQLGSRAALVGGPQPQAMPSDHPQVAGQQATPSLEEMTANLAARLESDPDNLEGWRMLGRSYMAMQRHAQARDAYARAYALAPDEPQIISEYAETLALAQGGALAGRPMQLVARLLEMDPAQPNGLWLSGLAAVQQEDFETAVHQWTRLSEIVGSGEGADMLAQHLAGARARLGEPAAAPAQAAAADAPVSPPTPEGTPAGGTLSVQVFLAPALADKTTPSDTVFIFARAAQGPRMPLAIIRKTVGELPVSVTLDDSMAMTPAMRLSNFPEIVVGARISRSGNAMPQSGDLEGLSQPVADDRPQPVKITINRVI